MIDLSDDGPINMKELKKFFREENRLRKKFERGELDSERISP
jgi:hypothetical protein